MHSAHVSLVSVPNSEVFAVARHKLAVFVYVKVSCKDNKVNMLPIFIVFLQINIV